MTTPQSGQFGQNQGAPQGGPWSERIQLEAVAAYLAHRRKRQSLRDLAREIGISKSSVDDLVKAYHEVRELPQPYGNWQKLKDWYLKHKHQEAGHLQDPADMAMLFLEVIAGMPEAAQRRGLQRLVEFVGRMYDDEKAVRPAWLKRLEEGLREGPAEPPGAP
ncbi:MAG TPA: hypothetical protein VF746_01500 [Longimicrobium sp.]